MTRYDPHPQDYDDARTFGPADAERRPHDGMPHRGSCGDCGALLTVPNVVGTTQPDATDRRESDGSGVPEEGGGLREALEALADGFADTWAQRRADADREPPGTTQQHVDVAAGQAWWVAERNLRAVLAAHPTDAPAEDPLDPDHAPYSDAYEWQPVSVVRCGPGYRIGVEGCRHTGVSAEAQEPSGGVVRQAARVLHAWDVEGGPCEGPWKDLTETQQRVWRSGAQALADAGLLADTRAQASDAAPSDTTTEGA